MQYNKLKKDKFLDSPYTTSGGKESCTNVFTGETVKMSNEHWGYSNQIYLNNNSSIEDKIKALIKNLPNILDLTFLKKQDLIYEDYSIIRKDVPKEEIENYCYGTIEKICKYYESTM